MAASHSSRCAVGVIAVLPTSRPNAPKRSERGSTCLPTANIEFAEVIKRESKGHFDPTLLSWASFSGWLMALPALPIMIGYGRGPCCDSFLAVIPRRSTVPVLCVCKLSPSCCSAAARDRMSPKTGYCFVKLVIYIGRLTAFPIRGLREFGKATYIRPLAVECFTGSCSLLS